MALGGYQTPRVFDDSSDLGKDSGPNGFHLTVSGTDATYDADGRHGGCVKLTGCHSFAQ